jgi:F-type H+-transporting ATPase subunit epsilon
MAAFQFELVSPEKLLFSGEVEAVTAPGTEGEFTVLKDHAAFLTTLRPGKVSIKGGGADDDLYVRGGFADVSPDGFTILADFAIPLSEVDASVIDKDIELAEAAIEDAVGDETKRVATEQRDHLREFKATLGR